MKKFAILALAALLVVAFTVPASALENTFGGYWRTRFFTQRDFAPDDTGAKDLSRVDTRTRLFYTAKLNDNLKFVNKFEMDAVWGDYSAATSNYGDAGADGIAVEVKNSYADFKVGPVNFLVGVQPFVLARGFISDDDNSGIKAIWKVNDGLYIPFIWQRAVEGGQGKDRDDFDVDAYILTPIIYLSKDVKINPYYVYFTSDNATLSPTTRAAMLGRFEEIGAHVLGVDFDAKMGAASLWFTGIYQKGTLTTADALLGYPTGTDIDLKAYLVAAGGKFDLGKADIHGQFFYASGDDDGLTDKEIDSYYITNSGAYYWAEILGAGIFDNQTPLAAGGTGSAFGDFQNGGGAPMVQNMMALNAGVTIKPMDKLKVSVDLWWAKLAEENAFGEDELGIEADVAVSYQLVEGLTLDIVGAYLFAGDALSVDGKNDNDPYEVGTRLSLSF